MKLAAGNWKMNGLGSNLGEVQRLIAAIGDPKCQVLICPPATLIDRMSILALDTPLHVGGQDCHAKTSGAHTGDVSAAMLANAGASVEHSTIAAKAQMLSSGLPVRLSSEVKYENFSLDVLGRPF